MILGCPLHPKPHCWGMGAGGCRAPATYVGRRRPGWGVGPSSGWVAWAAACRSTSLRERGCLPLAEPRWERFRSYTRRLSERPSFPGSLRGAAGRGARGGGAPRSRREAKGADADTRTRVPIGTDGRTTTTTDGGDGDRQHREHGGSGTRGERAGGAGVHRRGGGGEKRREISWRGGACIQFGGRGAMHQPGGPGGREGAGGVPPPPALGPGRGAGGARYLAESVGGSKVTVPQHRRAPQACKGGPGSPT